MMSLSSEPMRPFTRNMRFFVGVLGIMTSLLPTVVMAALNFGPPTVVQGSYPSFAAPVNFDDLQTLGGAAAVDKIFSIKVYTTSYLVTSIISQMEVTYKMKGNAGNVVLRSGTGGTLAGTIDLSGSDQFLTSVATRTVGYIYHIKFCRNDGFCFGPYGGNVNDPSTESYQSEKSVIKGFYGNQAALLGVGIVAAVSVYYEVGRVHHADIVLVSYTPTFQPYVQADQSFDQSMNAVQVLDNTGKATQSSQTYSFQGQAYTSETSTVTTAQSFTFPVTLSTSTTFTYRYPNVPSFFQAILQWFFKTTGASFTIGRAFSTVLIPAQRSYNMTTPMTLTYTVVANPFTRVQSTVYYRSLSYGYTWSAQVNVYYANQPSQSYLGGTLDGTLTGSQPFPTAYVKYAAIP